MKDIAGKMAFVTGGLGGQVRVGIGDDPSACAGKTNRTLAAELSREPAGANARGLLS